MKLELEKCNDELELVATSDCNDSCKNLVVLN